MHTRRTVFYIGLLIGILGSVVIQADDDYTKLEIITPQDNHVFAGGSGHVVIKPAVDPPLKTVRASTSTLSKRHKKG